MVMQYEFKRNEKGISLNEHPDLSKSIVSYYR